MSVPQPVAWHLDDGVFAYRVSSTLGRFKIIGQSDTDRYVNALPLGAVPLYPKETP